MKKLTLSCVAALAMATATTPAFAQHVSPANTTMDFVGPAQLDRTPLSLSCDLTLNITTGPDVGGAGAAGGTINYGTNTAGNPLCPLVTVDATTPAATFTIDSFTSGGGAAGLGSGTGSVYNLQVSVNSNPQCSDAGPLPFTIENTSATTARIYFDTDVAGVGSPDCHVIAELDGPAIDRKSVV